MSLFSCLRNLFGISSERQPTLSDEAILDAMQVAEHTLSREGYRLVKIIGEGGYGRVWLAHVPGGGTAALKIVARKGSDDAMLAQEREALRRISAYGDGFKSLAKIERLENHGDHGFLSYTMPLADDITGYACPSPEEYRPKTVAEIIRDGRRMSVDECVAVARRVLAALKELHEQNLVHWDVKPANVIYVKGVPTLADIGLVMPDSDAPPRSGTEYYMSPDDKVTFAGDLYSVGVLLYRMATGNRAEAFPSLKRSIRDPRFGRLRRVYEMAGDHDPGRRYTSAEAMMLALDWVMEEERVKPRAPVKNMTDLLLESLHWSEKAPDLPGMKAFKTYVRNIADSAETECGMRQAPDPNYLTPDDLAEVSARICLEFERRLGHEPTAVRIACKIAQAQIEPNRRRRKDMLKCIADDATEPEGVGEVISCMGRSLGWNKGLIEGLLKTAVDGTTVVPMALVAATAKALRKGNFFRSMFRRDTPQNRAREAKEALLAGIDAAIGKLWGSYGKHLTP